MPSQDLHLRLFVFFQLIKWREDSKLSFHCPHIDKKPSFS